ncbi:MAG: DNA-binding response regulator [Conexibacter sp.]|nr:DNA-binding response regulator [Conexibacter sp.]
MRGACLLPPYDDQVATTILLVEDEPSIGSLVRTYLAREGFRVLWVRSGEDALAELPRHPIELIVLDIGLPGIDGFEVCRRVGGRVPIIMLTARDDEPDRVAGLEAGADDYVPKPFSPRELAARVKAVLRRSRGDGAHAADARSLGPVTLSRTSREVRVDGREVELTQREFDLLDYLIERPNTVVSRDDLLESVWGFLAPGETRTVEVHVAQLRKKLGRPELIRTVRGVGYKAVAA